MLSELSSPRLIISRKRNQRKLKTRSQRFDPSKLQNSLDLSLESLKGVDNSQIRQSKPIQISQLNLNFKNQNQKPQKHPQIASTRFRTIKIEMENDSLRAENQDLKQQLKDLRQLLELRTCQQSKQSESTISTIVQEAVHEQQSLLIEIDLLKQICQSFKIQNHHLKKQLQLKQFNVLMLKKKIDFKPRPNIVKYNRDIDQLKICTKCKGFREMKNRNKTLNELVLSLSDRLNNFTRDNRDELFQLSPN